MKFWCCIRTGLRSAAAGLLATALMLSAGPGHAQATVKFPEKAVRLLVAFPPGGALDASARALAKQLSDIWGQSVFVDNRPGAAGILAAQILVHAPADGYTISLIGVDLLTVVPFIQETKMPYDSLNDLVPVGLTVAVPLVLVTSPDLKVKTLSELVNAARARPGAIDYASSGNGSPSHMAIEKLQRAAAVKLNHVPYKGVAPALQDLIAGRVQLMFAPLASVLPFLKNGKLIALAYGSLERSPLIPQVPTVAESGYAKFEGGSLAGIMVPKGTPPPLVEKISADVAKAVRSQAYRDALLPFGNEVRSSTSREFGDRIRTEYERNSTLIKTLGIKAE